MVPDDSAADDSASDDPTPFDPTPDNVDEPEAEMLPDNPAEKFEVEAPRAPDPSTNDADPELKKRFWTLVVLFNVALLGISLGTMLIGFEDRWLFGGAFFVVGAVAFLRGWSGYRDATSDTERPPDRSEDASRDSDDSTSDAEAEDDDSGVRNA